MKLLAPISPRWYSRLNDTMVVTALLIGFGWVLLNFVFKNQADFLLISVGFYSALVSFVGVLYGLIGYRLVVKSNVAIAGTLSFVLLAAIVGALVLETGGFTSQYLLLWAIVALFSAMPGWLTFSLTWLATHIYIVLAFSGKVAGAPDSGDLLAYLLTIEIPFLASYFLWYGQAMDSKEQNDSFSEIGMKDVSQDLLISSIAEGVMVIDEEKIIQVFNPAAAQTTGWSELDARGIGYQSVLTLSDSKGKILSGNDDPINRVFLTGETVVENNGILKTRNGKTIDISLVASPIKNKSEGVVAVVAVFRDVSEERSQERQRAEFISTASHEMRTPVAAIEGYLALAMNDQVSKIDSKAREYLDKAHSSTQHLGKLFQDLLTAAKSEDGRLQNNPEVVEMGQLVDELADGMRFTAEKKGLILEYEATSGLTPEVSGGQTIRPLYFVHADPGRIREVITNLFDNAVKYTEEGKVSVRITGDDENVTVSVADTGPGIAQEDIPHLFQKFYRVDNTATRQIGGTGLGLFISRKIVELNNGKIWVESKVGEGSKFYISLPRLSNDRAQTLQKQQAASTTPLSNVTGNVEL